MHKDSFYSQVYYIVAHIPAGEVRSYGDIAKQLGKPNAARQVGWALAALKGKDSSLPWHRVVNAQMKISLKNHAGAQEQRQRLLQEGLYIDASGRITTAHSND